MLTERTVFVNGIPELCRMLTKVGRKEEAEKLVGNFLNSTFSSDLNEKIERFLQVPSGIFLADTPYFRIFWEFNQIYIAGLYYTTVVTAGVLCERICLDILERNKTKPKKKAYLGDLISLISRNNLARKDSLCEMKKIQTKRNEYVHPKMTALDNRKDAFDVVQSISTIMQNELRVWKH